ncbi:MAG: GIY-YIG nuclease family protein [Rhizobiales bacterium]|nr:GIY-YIG nuclease family protein [Hyphomicrobiales bacterium]
MSRFEVERRRKPIARKSIPLRLRQKMYFIFCETTQSIKCGIATSTYKRLFCLQTGSPTILRLVAEIEGDRERERAVHRRLTHFRRHGEWFRYTNDVREIIIEELTSHLRDKAQFDARERFRKSLPQVRSPP